ncbi:MAG: hypothetical protein KJ558_12920 [Gammaproteobacteria bacterium]|nr:hypothetical protein [Gammaproteobacteria bacterium]MBU1655703.1 hypothetical protein [Gammaproteobacteria bacterium]MBU1961191.1 hypothetical protein [Gammaproteobacteria bacterium]
MTLAEQVPPSENLDFRVFNTFAAAVPFLVFHFCAQAMLDINPITNAIADLKGRTLSLRGYL